MPGTTTPLRERRSRMPTGLPNPPMILLAGQEKTGKSHEAVLGTSSDLVGMTYWIEIGGLEGTADYYGRIKGARYEIVEHDGTYQDILDAVRWAVAQPPVDGKANMIVVDNVSNLWDMLSDEQALYARRRAMWKAQENRRRVPTLDDPVVVDPDLWNRAKDRWGEILWLLRRHSGPTLLLARQEIVTAFENDKPTRNRTRKIKAEKNLPAAVDAIVELHSLGEAYLTGVRTLHWEIKPGESTRFDDFSIDELLRRLGFEEAATARQVTESRPEAYLDEQQNQHPQQQSPQGQPQPAPQAGKHPRLADEQAAKLVRQALEDGNDPEACLHAIRQEWGVRTLQQVVITTPWGEMSADAAITRSLAYIKERADQKQQGAPHGQGNTSEQQGQRASNGPPLEQTGQEQARAHVAPAEQSPPGETDAPPLPPDPQADEAPPNESAEETSAAEEPQDVVPPVTARPRRSRTKNEGIAYQALMDEAEVQARVKCITVGEHLGAISEDGEPGLATLRDFVRAHRDGVAAALAEAGETELADAYRAAPMPDVQITKKFAAYFGAALVTH
ncbi:hypothetical protein [Streptomyces sp. NBC_00620]|uniref:hypothetical protein n=1 Tax=Streptomyces sp. NBC_00620 TaxID=2903666 RepID=UPI00225A15B7|nr:hypothetical protein [Streptomyces sp. NBC_00620]MCX4976425.1 hypothetical protein [Streptomyces sp. NBC_00620]